MPNKNPLYKCVLLKVSGEALMGDKQFGHDHDTMKRIAEDIKEVHDMGLQVAVVVGGGNIFRGKQAENLGMERAAADYMGMLGTVMNALALQNILEKMDVYTRVQSAIPMMSVCETYVRRKAKRHMQKGRVVIFAGGTGNPFFTTDFPAVLRAIEMNCDVVLKATQVDGVYSADPKKDKNATRYGDITYSEMLDNNLNVMDMAAIALARENKLPIKVFSIRSKGEFAKVICGEGRYTKVQGD